MDESSDVFGMVLKTQFESKEPIFHVIERDDGHIRITNTQIYFQPREAWSLHEREILSLAKPPILDIGCGAGRHVLYLQNKGLDVTGLDVSEGALYVCKQRGVKKTILGSVPDLQPLNQPYTTFLLMFNNFGLSGNPKDTIRMLKNFHHQSTHDAKIILCYLQPFPTQNPFHLAIHQKNREAGRPIGQVRIRVRFEGFASPWWYLWLPMPEEFLDVVHQGGWNVSRDLNDKGLHHVLLEKQ